MAKKTKTKATSVGQTDASPKLDHQTKPAKQESVHVETDYLHIQRCLGCDTLINVKSPWGRFDEKGKEAGVCGIECNKIVLNRRSEEMMAPHH